MDSVDDPAAALTGPALLMQPMLHVRGTLRYDHHTGSRYS